MHCLAVMAGQWISRAEQEMRATIELLLALPADGKERQRMEAAESCTFTYKEPAPRWTPPKQPTGNPRPVVATVHLGTVEAAALLCAHGWRPAVMNFAHGYNCGGGFEHAGGSQEEDIFRKTSLFLSLWPHRREDDGPGVLARGMWIGEFDEGLPRKEPFYPHTECGGIYSPHVRVLRQLTAPGRPLATVEQIEDAHTFGVLTVAAQDCGRTGPFDPELLRQKLRTTMHMAVSHGHDSVVFGAFGCGYFRNPADAVAVAFDELLRSEFADAFRVVLFAVPARQAAFESLFKVEDQATLARLVSTTSATDTAAGPGGGPGAPPDHVQNGCGCEVF